MGCHTWVYEKMDVDEGTLRRIKNDFLSKYNRLYNVPPDELYDMFNKEMDEKYPDLNPEDRHLDITKDEFAKEINHMRDYCKRNHVLDSFKNGRLEVITIFVDFNDYFEGKRLVKYHNGNFYALAPYGADFFRVSGYPENKFTDAENLIGWLKTRDYVGYHGSRMESDGVTEELEEEIRQMFREHPDTLVEFG